MSTSAETTWAPRGRRRSALGLALAAGLGLVLLGPGAALAAPPAAPVIADLQVRELAVDQRYVIHVRSTVAQAFDILPSPAGTVRVRLYGVRLGSLDGIEAGDFGTVTLSEEQGGSVLLRIDLADPRYRAHVGQGGNASTVQIRLAR